MTDFVKEFFDKRKLNKAAYDTAVFDNYSKIFMTAAGAELKENFDFKEDQLAIWAQGTIMRMRALLIPDDNEPTEADAG